MRIMSLNTWAGCVDGLVEYIDEKSRTCDVLCLQEVHHAYGPNVPEKVVPTDPGSRTTPQRPHLFKELRQRLARSHTGLYAPQLQDALHDSEATSMPIMFGNALFYSDRVVVNRVEYRPVYEEFGKLFDEHVGTPSCKSMQTIVVQLPEYQLLIGNIHGFWHPDGKVDMRARDLQSKKIASMLKAGQTACGFSKPTELLLIGDFNYTSSMRAMKSLVGANCFGKDGGIHLNQKFGIKDTRTKWYKKEVREADHAIVSPGLPVTNFFVDNCAPSDHAALFVEIKD